MPFVIVPIFGFANAGVSLRRRRRSATLVEPLTLGVAAGLVVGKLVGVFGIVGAGDPARLRRPAGATPRWPQMLGVALLCGIGFTMSLFIGLLAFASDLALQDAVKLGILAGSLLAALLGAAVLLVAPAAGGGGRDRVGLRRH